MQPIKAQLLATSETSKLEPLTESMPSPMVPLVNRPVMAYMVELLARQSIKDIVVSVYHMAGQIEGYFGSGNRWGVSLEYALQSQPMGTAGSLKWARRLLPETFIVLPADCLIDLNITAALEYHTSTGCSATIIEQKIPAAPFMNGAVSANGEERVSRLTGAYIINSEALDHIPARQSFDICKELIPALSAAGLGVSCYESDGYYNPLESFEDYRDAQKTVLRSSMEDTDDPSNKVRYFSLAGRRFASGIWIGQNQVIHPNARLTPPVFIGDNTYIGREVELGPDTVIGSNVVIDDEATISGSTVLDGTYVGNLVHVQDRLVNKSLIIDLNTAEFMQITDDFLLGHSYQADLDKGLRRVADFLLALPLFILLALLSVPISLLLLIVNGKAYKRIPTQYFRPNSLGEQIKVTFDLLHFNVKGRNGAYNWFGRMLKRLEIHRWPELWNFIKGDLQLVGVKPLTPENVNSLNELWHQPRHEQRPGLTGLWYINTRAVSVLDEFVVADIYYLATQSWREDMNILLRTPLSWLKRISKA